MNKETLDEIQQKLWSASVKLVGIGELIASRDTNGHPLDDDDVCLGVGMAVKGLGVEVLSLSERIEIKPTKSKKKKRK